jgi:ATPase subunit of ABC transporter with duplicated ATPase domains
MAESIAQQVRKLLGINPDMTNQELYSRFPNVRPNTIRHYKSGFLKMTSQTAKAATGNVNRDSLKTKIANSAQKAAGKFQKPDLEKRVATLEKKVDQLMMALNQTLPASQSKKSMFSMKSDNLDKRIKELEQNLLSFITEKRNKIKSDMSSLDELQQVMSNKISQFLAGLKNKR